MKVARTIQDLAKRKWIINRTGNFKRPKWGAGPNLPTHIVEQMRDLDIHDIECYKKATVTSASKLGEVPLVGDLPPPSPINALADILEITEISVRAHSIGWDLHVMWGPNQNLEDWIQTKKPAKCNGVDNRTLRVPASRDPWDERNYTMHWANGPKSNKITIWFPDVTLEHHQATEAFKGWCNLAVKKIKIWLEARYGLGLIILKPHQKGEFAAIIIEDEIKVDTPTRDGEIHTDRSTVKNPEVEFSSGLRASTFQKYLADHDKIKKENEELKVLILQKFDRFESLLCQMADGMEKTANALKPKEQPKETDPEGMFR